MYESPVVVSWTARVVLLIESGNGTVMVPVPATTLTCLPFTSNVPLPRSFTEIVVAFAATVAV